MKSVVALAVVAVMAWVGFRISDPLYDAAAESICTAHAEERGFELVESDGWLGYGKFNDLVAPSSTPKYECEFRNSVGDVIHLDQLDGVMDRTWRYHWLRFSGWLSMIAPIAAGMTLAGASGLLKRD